jgi:hypothetical protein
MDTHEPPKLLPPIDLRTALAADDWVARMLLDLVVLVGGVDALETLDARPLPDEPFDSTRVAAADRARVAEVLALADRCCETMFDAELRTAARRLLARVAGHDPSPLRRAATCPERLAAALVWVVARGNRLVGRRARRRASELWFHCRVNPANELGERLRAAAGIIDTCETLEAWPRELWLGDVALLVSSLRGPLVAQRDRWLQQAAREAANREARRPFRPYDDRRVEARAQMVTPLLACKGVGPGGRAYLLLGFGEHHDDAELFALSIPDAYHLAGLLGRALADPLPTLTP